MTFLLDQDTPDDLAYSLQTLDHEVVRLREVLPVDAADADVLSHAHAHNWVMVTCNRDDFLSLAQSQPHAGIIILIRRKSRVAERSALVRLLDGAGEESIRNNINFA
jgi:predicted nuclease of predicted toxin-antitoxin system